MTNTSEKPPILHKAITTAVEAGTCGIKPRDYEPDADFIRIVMAEHILRNNREIPKKQRRPLSSGPLPESQNETTLARIFRTIVNDSLEPFTGGRQLPVRRISPEEHETTCEKAETLFGAALTKLQDGTFLRGSGQAMRLITQDSVPLLLQKGVGMPTYLSLQDVTVGGIRRRAGYLLGADIDPSYEYASVNNGSTVRQLGNLQILPSDVVTGVDALRPSLLTLPLDERESYLDGREWAYYKKKFPDAMNLITTMTMNQVVGIIDEAIA